MMHAYGGMHTVGCIWWDGRSVCPCGPATSLALRGEPCAKLCNGHVLLLAVRHPLDDRLPLLRLAPRKQHHVLHSYPVRVLEEPFGLLRLEHQIHLAPRLSDG